MVDAPDAQASTLDEDCPVYLKRGVKIEPLVCGWLAWGHLLAPVQSAMNFAYRYLPLLQSFLANSQVHIAATQDPRLMGGPFVHLPREAIPLVSELVALTRNRLGRLLQLAADIKAFDAVLQNEAKGAALNALYARVPASLAGLIELTYDINSHPRIRFLEELLYAEYGGDLRQGIQQISLTDVPEAQRRFFMSTPRVPCTQALTIDIAYASPAIDTLAGMQLEPLPLRRLAESLGLAEIGAPYQRFFTRSPPPRSVPDYSGDGVRIRYFGHACVLIQTPSVSVLVDPTFATDPADPRDPGSGCPRLTIHDLPDHIDYLALSHCHADHFCPETLLQLRRRVGKVIVPLSHRGSITDPSMKLMLAELGFAAVQSLGHFDRVTFAGGSLTSIPFPGEHSDLEVDSKQSLWIEVEGRRLLLLVDSDGRDPALYRRIVRRVLNGSEPRIDALFLGMECHGAPLSWFYGPLLTKPIARRDDESRRLSGSNCERALQIIQQFECARVYVYALGQEPWLRHIMGMEYAPQSIQLQESDKLLAHCRNAGMVAERLYGSQDIFV